MLRKYFGDAVDQTNYQSWLDVSLMNLVESVYLRDSSLGEPVRTENLLKIHLFGFGWE
jgi:hypothetical protein